MEWHDTRKKELIKIQEKKCLNAGSAKNVFHHDLYSINGTLSDITILLGVKNLLRGS